MALHASKTRAPHIVPLATKGFAILRDLWPQTKRSQYIFPSVRGAFRSMRENTINVALWITGTTETA